MNWSENVPALAAWRGGGAEGRRGATRLFYAALLVVSLWIVMLPLVPAVTATVMRRFHLTTGSYLEWLPQQVVPAMYSFGNEFVLSEREVGLDEAFSGRTTWVNHYPPRMFTFYRRADVAGERFWLCCRSRYLGRELVTKTRIARDDLGGFEMSLEEERFAASSR